MKTIAQLLKHDFDKGSLNLYDSNGNLIYDEYSTGYWVKYEYDDNGNKIYYENSNGYWSKKEYDTNNNEIYYETSHGLWSKYEYDANGNRTYFESSNGYIEDNRPKESCEGKVVEIDGKTYKLVELM